MSSFISLSKVSKSYRRAGEVLKVLDAIDIDISEQDFVALMGPSGSGKTPILNLIGGLDTPDSGTGTGGGRTGSEMSARALPGWRARNVGFVFQSFNLIPVLTAFENVLLPLQLTPLSARERKEQANFALEVVGLTDRGSHRPSQLSGGEEQRVAIARAIATDPEVIIADEPTGDLDRISADSVLDLLRRLNNELDKTILMVTHDPAAAEFARRQLHLDKGVLIEDSAGSQAEDAR